MPNHKSNYLWALPPFDPVKAEMEGDYFQMILVTEAKGWESESGERR